MDLLISDKRESLLGGAGDDRFAAEAAIAVPGEPAVMPPPMRLPLAVRARNPNALTCFCALVDARYYEEPSGSPIGCSS